MCVCVCVCVCALESEGFQTAAEIKWHVDGDRDRKWVFAHHCLQCRRLMLRSAHVTSDPFTALCQTLPNTHTEISSQFPRVYIHSSSQKWTPLNSLPISHHCSLWLLTGHVHFTFLLMTLQIINNFLHWFLSLVFLLLLNFSTYFPYRLTIWNCG